MADTLFLYEKPFVLKNTHSTQYAYLSESARFTDFEREDENQIRETILKFAADHSLVVVSSTNKLVNNTIEDIGSWIWALSWMNPRSLVDEIQYSKFINILKSQDGEPINLLIDLHMRLGVLFDSHLLNTVVNRTMQAVKMIPFKVPDDHTSVDWETIHVEHPFIWIVILLQTILRAKISANIA